MRQQSPSYPLLRAELENILYDVELIYLFVLGHVRFFLTSDYIYLSRALLQSFASNTFEFVSVGLGCYKVSLVGRCRVRVSNLVENSVFNKIRLMNFSLSLSLS